MKQFFIVLIILGSLFILPVSASSSIKDINDRSIFNYELLQADLDGKTLTLKGWGLLPDTQNFYGTSTHQLTIEILSEGKRTLVKTNPTNLSLTKDYEYVGYRYCRDDEKYQSSCNYKYENVGFEATIDLSTLKTDQTYEIYLVIETKQTHLKYRTPLYYAQEKQQEITLNDNKVFLNASFETMVFEVFDPTLRVTSTPHHSSSGNHMSGGGSCSATFSNKLYYQQYAQFSNPKTKVLYNDLISYYKVGIDIRNCVNSRRRVVEGDGSLIAYVPSTLINYKGKPLTISIVSPSKPILSVEDHFVNQYDDYFGIPYASAYDKDEGDISSNIIITNSNVNTRIPGLYETCYSVHNKQNRTDAKCAKVTVVPIRTRIRYINSNSVDYATLQLWGINAFKTILLTILGK